VSDELHKTGWDAVENCGFLGIIRKEYHCCLMGKLLFLHIGSGLRIRHPFEGSLEAPVGFLSLF